MWLAPRTCSAPSPPPAAAVTSSSDAAPVDQLGNVAETKVIKLLFNRNLVDSP